MNSFVIAVIAVSIGFFIGRTLEATHDARSRFVNYRSRTMSSLHDWVNGTLRTVVQVSVVLLVLYLVFVTHTW